MLEGLARRYPLLRVVYEDLAQQVEEEAVEVGRLWNDVLKSLHATHELPRLAWGIGHWVRQMAVLEESGRRVSVTSLGDTLNFADERTIDRIAGHSL